MKSYNYYLSNIDKSIVKKIRELSYEELCNKYGNGETIDLVDIPQKKILNFKKLDNEIVEIIAKDGEPLFLEEEMKRKFSYFEPYIINIILLDEIIFKLNEIYKKEAFNIYNDMLIHDDNVNDIYEKALDKSVIYTETLNKLNDISAINDWGKSNLLFYRK